MIKIKRDGKRRIRQRAIERGKKGLDQLQNGFLGLEMEMEMEERKRGIKKKKSGGRGNGNGLFSAKVWAGGH